MLALNALIFRLPYTIWKFYEGGMIKEFCSSEARSLTIMGDEKSLQILAESYVKGFKRIQGQLQNYYIVYQITQCLNVAMALLNFYINHEFLYQKYWSYGSDWLKYDASDLESTDPLCNVFPTTVSCTMKKGGVNTVPETVSGMCILSQNIINEKIYLILWFWLYFVLFAGILQVVIEVLLLLVPALRDIVIKMQIGSLLTSKMKAFLHDKELGIGDWFFLSQIGRNSSKNFFYCFLQELAESKSETQADQAPLLAKDAMEMDTMA